MDTGLSTTHISICYVLLPLLTVMDTGLSTTHISSYVLLLSLTVSMDTGLSTTHISICYVLLLLVTISMDTGLSTTHISICFVAIGDYINRHRVSHYKIIRSCCYIDYIHVGSAIAYFEDLVTLHRRILQKIFCRGSAMASFGHGNS